MLKKLSGILLLVIVGTAVPASGCKKKTQTPTGPTSTCQRTVSVSSQAAWQDSGCDVTSGDRISISASGTIRFDSAGATASPNGSGRGAATAGPGGCTFLLCGSSIPQHSLVGRIGSNSLQNSTAGFFVGSSFSTTSSSTGRLYLGFNDGFVRPDRSGLDSGGVGDNSGTFSATITVSR